MTCRRLQQDNSNPPEPAGDLKGWNVDISRKWRQGLFWRAAGALDSMLIFK